MVNRRGEVATRKTRTNRESTLHKITYHDIKITLTTL